MHLLCYILLNYEYYALGLRRSRCLRHTSNDIIIIRCDFLVNLKKCDGSVLYIYRTYFFILLNIQFKSSCQQFNIINTPTDASNFIWKLFEVLHVSKLLKKVKLEVIFKENGVKTLIWKLCNLIFTVLLCWAQAIFWEILYKNCLKLHQSANLNYCNLAQSILKLRKLYMEFFSQLQIWCNLKQIIFLY